ncbi:hypothetical protein U2I54_28125 [Bacillus pseudomycoides]|uniref:F0F1 ATP synthase subunit alpha n=1 Tax=Bacillus bingmayongensis TaxID=1150157 RepID=A0ABU5K4T6_9BACI|nr:hypothetical protein [Bacillus pseudomycoides]
MKKLILAGVLGIGALTATNLPGLGMSTASAAVQEVQETVEGIVIEVSHNYFVIENKQTDEIINVKHDFKSTVKVGEYVKITSNAPLLQNAFQTFATASSIEHLTLAPGDYEDFVVGHVSKIYPPNPWGYPGVKVDFPTKDGNTSSVIVDFEPEKMNSFHLNNLVKVEKNGWNKTNPASTFEGIEKVKSQIDSAKTQGNDDIWIWN